MNPALEQQLTRIVNAVHFQSDSLFTFAGRPSTAWAGYQPDPNGPVSKILEGILYGYCYCHSFDGAINDKPQGAPGPDDDWVEMLSQANSSKERWEEGWQVQQFLPNGQVHAQKYGATRSFWPGEFLSRASQGMAPMPGTPIAAFFPRESRDMQPGFYFALGETPGDQQDDYSIVRYYWNLRREGAAPLTRSLTTALNRYQTPFKFKIINHPAALGRTDAAILYVSRRYYRIAAEIALETHASLNGAFAEGTPLFALPLAKGLSFAEDTGTQESFGQVRCRLLAEALHLAFREGSTRTPERLEYIRRHFENAGTSLDRPHLNFATTDPYEFPQ